MFLNKLNTEEKKSFLQLAHHVARIDDEFSEKQKTIISEYCVEMQIEDAGYNGNEFKLEQALSVFTDSKNQKIALLEIMALVYSDGVLHSAEETVLQKIVEQFGLNPNVSTVYKEWAKAALAIYAQGKSLVEI